MVEVETVLSAAQKSGALIRYRVPLEQGEFDERRLWLRPEVAELIRSGMIDVKQRETVRAALKRFVTGGKFTVVTAECGHREVESLGDIRELKGDPPPFIEFRFKPPKHDLRLFGRFVAEDALVLTTHGMKSLTQQTGQKKLSVPAERQRCDTVLRSVNVDLSAIPQAILQCITKANFI